MKNPTREERLHTMYVVIARSSHMFLREDVKFPEEEYEQFAKANGYDKFYDQWKLSGFKSMFLPVTVRLDEERSWEVNNMLIVSMADNMDNNIMSNLRLAERTTRQESSHGMDKTRD